MALVLVVEDDIEICELLDLVLSDEGHHVQCARSISKALDLAREQPPDVIIFDMTLPEGGGATLLRRLRELPEPHARTIAVSGIEYLEEEAHKIGADAALSKPYELDELLTLVNGARGKPAVFSRDQMRPSSPLR